MSLSRRAFAVSCGGIAVATPLWGQDDPAKKTPAPPTSPVEAPFTRDYTAPSFKPSWKKQQLNRQMVQDFVIFAHSDLKMVKQLLEKEPALLNGCMDWGAGDWETALGGASHMGRRDIVEYLLENGARCDLFCSTMLGQLEVVKTLLTMQPKLIDAKGPHGFSLHFHAKAGGKQSEPVLEYLQSIKKVELKPTPSKSAKTPPKS